MNDTEPVRIAGGPEIVVRRRTIGTLAILADRAPLRRLSRLKSTYALPMADGTVEELRLMGQFTGLRARVRGHDYPLERQMARWEAALTWLPFALIALGGLVGGVIAFLAIGVNTGVVRRIVNTPVRAGALVVVAALAFGLWFITVRAIVRAPALTAGACLNGVREGADLSSNTTHIVECTTAHDSEVVGTYPATGTGAYPGQRSLVNLGEAPCRRQFSTYVGTDLDSSKLTMLLAVPTDQTWADGARQITCLVVASNGARLTGSVLATGR